ncbi:MAG: hypothetical protein AAGJ38_01000 [Planctomycetota bacterium]
MSVPAWLEWVFEGHRACRIRPVKGIGLVLACMGGQPASGVVIEWIDTAGGFYETSGNWSPAQTPTDADDLEFRTAGVYSVRWDGLTGPRVADSLSVIGTGFSSSPSPEVTFRSTRDTSGDADLDLDGTVTGGNALEVRENARLTLGEVVGASSQSFRLTSQRNGLVFDDATLTLNNRADLSFKGFSSTATLRVENATLLVQEGSSLSADTLAIIQTGSFGGGDISRIQSGATVDVRGLQATSESTFSFANAELVIDGAGTVVNVGFDGVSIGGDVASTESIVTVSSGADLNVTGNADIGGLIGNGRLNITNTGTTVDFRNIDVGASALGNLTLSDGAALTTERVSIGSFGRAVVSGTGTTWNTSRQIDVDNELVDPSGFSPSTGLAISEGATVTISSFATDAGLRLGSQTSRGSVQVANAGSKLEVQNAGVVATGSQSAVSVTGGAELVADFVQLRDGAQLTIGGSLELETIDVTDGDLDFGSGSLTLTSSQAILPIRPKDRAFFSIDGFKTVSNAGLTIIEPGATLEIRDDAAFSSSAIRNEGRIQVRDFGSDPFMLTLGNAEFGSYRGSGDLILDSGASVQFLGTVPTPLGLVTEIDGGTIESAGGISLGSGSVLSGFGRVAGPVSASLGTTIVSNNDLRLGDATSAAGFETNGVIQFETFADLTLDDANRAGLGVLTRFASSFNTLTADNGLVVDFGDTVEGPGTITVGSDESRSFINNGVVGSALGRLTLNGYVQGVGTFDNVTFNGTFAPGLSPAAVTVGAATYAGSLEIELGGTNPGSEYDQVNHTLGAGTAQLSGTLDVSLLPGFAPEADDAFTVLTATNGFTGAFDEVRLPALAGGLTWDVQTSVNAITLAVVGTAGLIGDYNDSGTVEQGDLNLVLTNWGTNRTFEDPGGTAFATIIVDQEELNLVLSNWGSTTTPSFEGFNIPEPASTLILALCGLRRRRNAA